MILDRQASTAAVPITQNGAEAEEPGEAGRVAPEPQPPTTAVPTAELIQVDRYLLRIERLLETRDYAGAFSVMEQIAAIYDTYAADRPPELDYRYAQTATQAGAFQAARVAANRYLAVTGRDGPFYGDVLELLDLIDQNDQSLDLCTTAAFLASCWRVPAEPSRCAIWDSDYEPDLSVTWSGSCIFGKAHGEGELTWTRSGNGYRNDSGIIRNGHKQGEWIERSATGNTEAGTYADGIRQGQWILTTGDGSNNDGMVQQGLYLDGERDGPWEFSWRLGGSALETYDVGVRSGPTILRFANGEREEGQYLDWAKEGVWRRFDESGDLYRSETFVSGVLNGPWRRRSGAARSCVSSGNYVEGQREGQWTECEESRGYGAIYSYYNDSRALWSGAYVGGEKSGSWAGALHEDVDYYVRGRGDVDERFVPYGRIEGAFSDGSAVVTAIREKYNNPNARGLVECREASKTSLVDGKLNGTQWRLDQDCQCAEVTWINGNRVEENNRRRGNCNREIFGR